MEKFFTVIVWFCCIGLLSFAYEDYLTAELSMREVSGVVSGKEKKEQVRNSFGNYQVEQSYILLIEGEEIAVTKRDYQLCDINDFVQFTRTRHGTSLKEMKRETS